MQPGVAVRLHDGDDAVCDNCAGGFQNGGDLDRVVAVIVDDRGAVPLAGLCEAALDAAELAQRRAHDLVANAELRADGDGRQRVLHIVDAEHRQQQIGDYPFGAACAIGDHRVEMAAIGVQVDIGGADIGLRAEAVGQDTPVRQFGDHALDDGMVDAQNRKPKNLERLMQCRDVAVKIEVFGIDVGDDRDRRRQARKGAVAFIRLDDHPVAGAEPRVGAVGVDNAAIDYGRIEPGGLQERADD